MTDKRDRKKSLREDTRQTLRASELAAFKKFGQNFLVDEGVLADIVRVSGVGPDKHVLEIGPGMGALTKELLTAAGHVIAVEIDTGMVRLLRETFAEEEHLTIVEGDILSQDIGALSAEYADGKPMKVIANLPYYITTPVLLQLFRAGNILTDFTVMVQKEVAERMCASAGTKTYGALSLAVQYYANAGIVLNVPPSAFYPQPKVESAVVHLERLTNPPVSVRDEETFFRFTKAAFSQRRKTFVNSVSDQWGTVFPKDKHRSREAVKELVKDALIQTGIPETARAETLSLQGLSDVFSLLAGELL